MFPKVVMHPNGEINGFKEVLDKLFQLLACNCTPKAAPLTGAASPRRNKYLALKKNKIWGEIQGKKPDKSIEMHHRG